MASGMKAFLIETKEDNKIRRLKARFPVLGKYVWIELLSNIYGIEGYYMKVDESIYEVFADEIHVKIDKLKKIVQSCLELELFDRYQFERNEVLTSASIQRRFMDYNRRSKKVVMQDCFLCDNFDRNVYKNLEIVYRNQKNVCNSETIQSNQIISNYIDDDYIESPLLNKQFLKEQLDFIRVRENEAFNNNAYECMTSEISKSIMHAVESITDEDVISKINKISIGPLYEIWRRAASILGLDDFAKTEVINNKIGYLRTTIENYVLKEMDNE